MKFRAKELRVAWAQNNTSGNYTVGAENRTKKTLKPPRTLSQLKSFMGSIHSLHKYLPSLAKTSAPLRPLISRKIEFIWTTEFQSAFENLKLQVAKVVELRNFDVHRDIWLVFHTSPNGLGAVLKQLRPEGWRHISFASRFLN